MAYSDLEKTKIFSIICSRVELGEALRTVLKAENMPSPATFYSWLENDESKVKQYARATELRAEAIFEDMITIADDSSNDEIEIDLGDGVKSSRPNTEFIQRSRLRVDTRKWIVSKLNPKKYGDKIDIDQKIQGSINIISLGNGTKPETDS
jgi:hypothetical protein